MSFTLTPTGAPNTVDILLERPDGRTLTLRGMTFYDPATRKPLRVPWAIGLEQIFSTLAPAYGDAPAETAEVAAFFGEEYAEFTALMRAAA